MSQSSITKDTLWHAGERTMQRLYGVNERMDKFGPKVVRSFMPDEHREFYHNLPYIFAGSVDGSGMPWASIINGEAGFIHTPTAQLLNIDFPRGTADPAIAAIAQGTGIGLLGLDLATRRRNRANGCIVSLSASGISLAIEHAFGNCPRYIQSRTQRTAESAHPLPPTTFYDGPALIPEAINLIKQADTFFVSSYLPREGAPHQVDVSHRGGQAGFVRVDSDGVLTIPDFAGNLHFNTLGNFVVNPVAGLLFIDFKTGDTLQMTGRTEILIDSPEIKSFEGAERLWTFTPTRTVFRRSATSRAWGFEGWSPHTQRTGAWQQP